MKIFLFRGWNFEKNKRENRGAYEDYFGEREERIFEH